MSHLRWRVRSRSLRLPGTIPGNRDDGVIGGFIEFVIFIGRQILVMDRVDSSDRVNGVDIVDMINDEYDDYQDELIVRNKKLKMIVDFSIDDDIFSILSDIKNSDISL